MAEPIPVEVKKAAKAWAASGADANGDAVNPNPVTRLADGALRYTQGGTTVTTGTLPSQTGGTPQGYMRVTTSTGPSTFTARYDRKADGTFEPHSSGVQQVGTNGALSPITNLSAADRARAEAAVKAEFERATQPPATAPGVTPAKPIGEVSFQNSLRVSAAPRPNMNVG